MRQFSGCARLNLRAAGGICQRHKDSADQATDGESSPTRSAEPGAYDESGQHDARRCGTERCSGGGSNTWVSNLTSIVATSQPSIAPVIKPPARVSAASLHTKAPI